MLTTNDAIRAAADLIAQCEDTTTLEDLATLLLNHHLTEKGTRARDLIRIAAAAISLARTALNESNIDTATFLDELIFQTHWDDLTTHWNDETETTDG